MTDNTEAPTNDALSGVAPAILAEQPKPFVEGEALGDVTDTAGVIVEAAPVLSRDEMRAKIFSAKPAFEIVDDFYGVRLELRQPSLAIALEARNQGETEAVFQMLLNYAFVPGTNEKVFEPTDVDMLRDLPFGPAMTDLMGKVNKLLGIDEATVAELLKDATKSTEG